MIDPVTNILEEVKQYVIDIREQNARACKGEDITKIVSEYSSQRDRKKFNDTQLMSEEERKIIEESRKQDSAKKSVKITPVRTKKPGTDLKGNS